MSENQLVSIGSLAKSVGIKVELIRYYESIDLFAPTSRTAGGNRLYNSAAIERLYFIRRARELGFSIEEIRELLQCHDHAYDSRKTVQQITKNHLQSIQTKIDDLVAIQQRLNKLLKQCQRNTKKTCPIIDALNQRI